MLRIRLVGGVAVDIDGRTIPPPASRRAWALLGWLALHPGLHSRADVAARLWPDALDTSARQSMRSALWSLRQALEEAGADLLVTTRDRVGLRDDVEVDVVRFDGFVAAGQLADAVEVGDGGALLAGVDDEWALVARDEHRERLIGALTALGAQSEIGPDAVQWTRRALALDPLSEDAARALMTRLVESGDRPAALAVYQRLAERLRRELHIPPSEPTWQLAEQIRTGVNDAPPPAVPAARQRVGEVPLVGRRDELEALRSAWERAANGAGGLAVVHGDAGIGKTKIVTAVIESCRRDGATCALGSPPDVAGEAFTPWIEVCSSLVGQLGELPVAPWVDVLARLVPTLVPSVATPAVPPDVEQARLSESVVALLEACALIGPVLIVMEDLHIADEASLAMLSHVARRMSDRPVLILATRRERPLRDRLSTLEQSQRQRGTLRADVTLGPLSERAVARLARAVGKLSDDAVEHVVGVADGNALLAVELARSLAAGDPLPLGLRGATRAAVARLPGESRALITALAVAGRDLDASEAAARAEVELGPALTPALDQGLLVASGDRIGFRHSLLREAVYADMSGVERSAAHQRAVAQLRAEGSHTRAAEAASHLTAIGQHAEAGQLLIQAAARARAMGALADATTLLRAAADALPEDPAPALELADVLAWRGRAADAQAAFAIALPLLEAAGDPTMVAEAHLRFAEWHYGPICQPSVSIPACRRALAVLDGSGLPAPQMRAQVLAVYAWCVAVAGDDEEIDPILGKLTDLVGDDPEDPLLGAGIDRTRSFSLLRQGRFDEALLPALRAAEVTTRLGRVDLTYTAFVNAAYGQCACGGLDTALDLLDQAAGAVNGHGMLAIEARLRIDRAFVLVRLGRLAEAGEAATQARRVADRLDAPDLQAVIDAERARVAMRAGEYETAATQLAAALTVPDASIGRPLARLQRAECLARLGRLDEAETELSEVVFEPVREGDWPETLVLRMVNVEGLIAAAHGDIDGARRRLEEAAQGWRRLTSTNQAERMSPVMADLGRPIIGLILPAEELAAAEADLAALAVVT